MTTFLWIIAILAVAAGVALIAWAQSAIWRRLDRIDDRLVQAERELIWLGDDLDAAFNPTADTTTHAEEE